jgi:hypothetical protein
VAAAYLFLVKSCDRCRTSHGSLFGGLIFTLELPIRTVKDYVGRFLAAGLHADQDIPVNMSSGRGFDAPPGT